MVGESSDVGLVDRQTLLTQEVLNFALGLDILLVAGDAGGLNGFHDPALLGVGQLVPGVEVDGRPHGVNEVVGQGDGFLHFVELGGLDGGQGIVLAVNGAGLESEIQIVEANGGRVRAHGLAEEHPRVGVRHAEVDALEILRGLDLLVLREGDLAGAEIERAEREDALLFGDLLEHILADVAVEDLGHVVIALENVAGGEHGDPGGAVGQPGSGGVDHVDVAVLERVVLGVLTVQSTGIVALNGHVAAGDGLEGLLEDLLSSAVGIGGDGSDGENEVDRLADVVGRFFDGLGRGVLGGSGGGLLGRSGGLTAGAERKQHDECEEHGDEFLHFVSSF